MRTRQLRTLIVSLILVLTFINQPVTAAPCYRDGWYERDLPFIGKMIKKIKNTFRVGSQTDGLTLPRP
jgi:hypothetical protein